MLLQSEKPLVSQKELARTNEIWNRCKINHPWSIGYTSSLIKHSLYNSFSEWLTYYFESGEERDLLVDALHNYDHHHWLRQFEAVHDNLHVIYNLPKSIQTLNFEYGRSWEFIDLRVRYFLYHLKLSNIHISQRLGTKIFLQRVLIDTWNGHVREYNTIQRLYLLYPQCAFKSSTPWSDFNHAIDYTIHCHNRLLGALQIKPASYRSNAVYVKKAQAINKKKNEKYSKRYGVPVWTIISNEDGTILDDGGLNIVCT